jgi:hypothetical protein
MNVEERVRLAMAEERTVVERSLQQGSDRLGQRRDELRRVTAQRRAGERNPDVVQVADAALAYDLMVDRVHFLQSQVRRLRSESEYQRRIERAGWTGTGRRFPPPESLGADPALPAAERRLEERRDALRRAAWVVKLCPEAGEPADLAGLAVAYERAAERVLVLDGAA